ncbi:MAG: DUF4127 family protein [Vulcanimicrobiaceae bacterium]
MKKSRVWSVLAFVVGVVIASAVQAAPVSSIVIVPLDDRPVTAQLPALLGRIAGIEVSEPPKALLGHYLTFGDPDGIIGWLNRTPHDVGAYVISNDMLVYGGLVASRVPGVSYLDARSRMLEYARLRRAHPRAWVASFATVMRLAPTGVPAIGAAKSFFAAYPIWTYIMNYANLHDPPLASERAAAARYRALAGAALDEYIATRTRNYQVDYTLLDLVAANDIRRVVLGQDDAGPVGLHVRDVLGLRAHREVLGLKRRAAIEPGADELGMVLVARAMARSVHWKPRIAVRYSHIGGAMTQDPIEFAPIHATISDLISLIGGVEVAHRPEIVLDVRVPGSTSADDGALLNALRSEERRGRSVALVDETFLGGHYGSLARFTDSLLHSGVASQLDAYAAWNTDANSVGTALSEAVAVDVGRRLGTYDALAHKTFTFMRIVDDVAFHADVRPQLNAALDAGGVWDHTYLLPDVAKAISERNRAALWHASDLVLHELYPGYHIAAMRITLPWNRTFETQIDVGIAPDLRR